MHLQYSIEHLNRINNTKEMKLNEPRQAGIRTAQNLTEGEARVKNILNRFTLKLEEFY